MSAECTIIAEAGVNHNGSVDTAFRLIDAAAEARVDWVKFQTFSAEKLVSRDARTAAYQKAASGLDDQFSMLKQLELPHGAFRDLAVHARGRGLGFLSTPFDIESAHFLAEIGMAALKIPSGELTNLPFLRQLGRLGLPIILSTGMATIGEVEAGIEVLESVGVKSTSITILHCTTEYPAPPEEVNLCAMNSLRLAFPESLVGYSDHTQGIAVSIAAAALGARVIEKHFTLDRNLPGPDHRASLEPAELTQMVEAIVAVRAALGDGRKRPTASELPNRTVARKSIVAARDISAGEPLTESNLTVRRPGDGLSPMRWDDLIGQPAARAYKSGEQISAQQ